MMLIPRWKLTGFEFSHLGELLFHQQYSQS